MTQYVAQISDGDPEFPPPYEFPGLSVLSFRVPAPLINLAALCNRRLNVGTLAERGFEYRPIWPFVDLDVLTYPKMAYAVPPYNTMGYTSQHECYVRIFVLKYVLIGGWLLPTTELATYMPFMVVDNPWSAFAGREVLGFPKLLGDFTAFSAINPYPKISTLAFIKFAANSKAQPCTVVEINPAAGPPAPPTAGSWPWGDLLAASPPALQFLLHGSGGLNPATFKTVQLKQFRDGEILGDACYQAIVEGTFTVQNVGAIGGLPPATVTFHDYPDLTVGASLGIPAGVPLQPLLQYSVDCDFEFTAAQTLCVLT
jgi:hypothetical protein